MTQWRCGFILTRHWRETADGTVVEFWLVTEEGPCLVRLPAQRCVAFIPAERGAHARRLLKGESGVELLPLELSDFSSRQVLGLYGSSYRRLVDLERRLTRAGIEVYEADILPPDRYMMERFINGPVRFRGASLADGAILVAEMRPQADFRPQLKVASLHAQFLPTGKPGSIALTGCGEARSYALETLRQQNSPPELNIEYCESYSSLIDRVNDWICKWDPDVIVGWDLARALHIVRSHGSSREEVLRFGRDGTPLHIREHSHYPLHYVANAAGRVLIDGVQALSSASIDASSGLHDIARRVLGKEKVIADSLPLDERDGHCSVDATDAHAKRTLESSELIVRIFDRLGLLSFLLERASLTGLPMDRSGGSVAAFTHLYLPRMHRLGYVAPNLSTVTSEPSPGGIVMTSRPGLYDSVLVLDYKSLYPSIIRTFLVDPVGLQAALRHPEDQSAVPGFLGARFSRTKHGLPSIVCRLWESRDEAKRSGNQPLSQAIKTIMNSFYGVLGSPGCRFFDPRLASSITMRGREIMRRTRELIQSKGFTVIYGDTDSIFVWLGQAHSEQSAHQIGQSLAEYVNTWWKQYIADTFALHSVLELQFERHYRRFFMPTVRGAEEGSKKRYAGLCAARDGSEEIIYKGLEAVRTDWTPLAQRFQRGLYARIFNNQPYKEYIRDYVDRLLRGDLDNLLAYTKRIRRPPSSYVRNEPPHVRAARHADQLSRDRGRPARYENGGWISYVMTMVGPETVENQRSRIDYQHYLSRQLQPVANAILLHLQDDFASIFVKQQDLLL